MSSLNLFPLIISSSRVTNRNFIKHLPILYSEGEDFTMLLPARGGYVFNWKQRFSVQQVTAIDICKGSVIEEIKNKRKKTIPNHMPEVMNPSPLKCENSTSDYNISSEF